MTLSDQQYCDYLTEAINAVEFNHYQAAIDILDSLFTGDDAQPLDEFWWQV